VQKILIIQTAFIGDVVLATPLVEKLHAFYPDAQIDFLLRKGNEGLLEGHPFIHRVLIWNKKKRKQKNLVRTISVVRKNQYDIVINLQRFLATGILTSFSGARKTIGFDKNPLSFLFSEKIRHDIGGRSAPHETERNLSLIRHITDDSVFKPRLYPSASDYSLAASLVSGEFITMSPASVWFTKQYPASQWIRFIAEVPERFSICLLGGPGDLTLCGKIAEAVHPRPVKLLAGKLSFLQSAALMSRASMNYVNDSAPLHFASAMNAPVTAIYCSTIPAFGFGPLSDIRHIVEIEAPLYCRPCGLHGYRACPEKHFRCAMDIRVEQLKATLP